MVGLLITFIAGLSFLLGFIISKKLKDKNKLYLLTLGLSLITLSGIIIFDLFPEVIENVKYIRNGIFNCVIFILLGFILMLFLDKITPHHTHHHKEHEKNIKEHNNHLFHISFLTTFGIIIHNYIEGMSIFILSYASITSSLLMCLSVCCHNIPIGMQISLNKSKKLNYLIILLILSTFLGGLTVYLFNFVLTKSIINSLISLTIGMTIYLIIFEFLKEILEQKNKKEIYKGIIIGIILIAITLLFE